jgi:hypothetical protein
MCGGRRIAKLLFYRDKWDELGFFQQKNSLPLGGGEFEFFVASPGLSFDQLKLIG